MRSDALRQPPSRPAGVQDRPEPVRTGGRRPRAPTPDKGQRRITARRSLRGAGRPSPGLSALRSARADGHFTGARVGVPRPPFCGVLGTEATLGARRPRASSPSSLPWPPL